MEKVTVRAKLIAEIAGKLLCTQTAQVQLWKSDYVDFERLEKLCVEMASELVKKVEKLES